MSCSLNAKFAGIWKLAKKVFAKVSGTWSVPSGVYAKNAGSWHLIGLPQNMVVLYDGTPPSGDICDGTNETPDLLNKFVSGSTTPLVTSGNATHTGEDHGSSVLVTTSASGHPSDNGLLYGSAATNVTSHTHTIPAHTHTGSVNNVNTIDKYKLIPVIRAQYFSSGAVFFNKASITGSGWAALIAAAKYLYLASTSGLADGTVHSHSATTSSLITSIYTAPLTNAAGGGGWPYSHYHQFVHSMNAVKMTPKCRQVIPFKYSGTDKLTECDLPSGTIALFTTTKLPMGWTRYQYADGRLIRLGSSEMDDGSDYHTHGAASKTTSSTIANANTSRGAAGSTNERVVTAHTHTWIDEHAAQVSSLPVNISLIIGVKL